MVISMALSDTDLRDESVQLPLDIDTLLCLSLQVAGLRLHPCSGYTDPLHVLEQITFNQPEGTIQFPSSFPSSFHHGEIKTLGNK